MRPKQWDVLGMGLTISGVILIFLSPNCFDFTGNPLIACYIHRYATGIPGVICIPLGILFMICGWIERKAEITKK